MTRRRRPFSTGCSTTRTRAWSKEFHRLRQADAVVKHRDASALGSERLPEPLGVVLDHSLCRIPADHTRIRSSGRHGRTLETQDVGRLQRLGFTLEVRLIINGFNLVGDRPAVPPAVVEEVPGLALAASSLRGVILWASRNSPSAASSRRPASMTTRSFSEGVHFFAGLSMTPMVRASLSHRERLVWFTPVSLASAFAVMAPGGSILRTIFDLKASVYSFT